MDVSELRKRIIRAIDDARKDATQRRAAMDEATAAYTTFLESIAKPLMQQAATVLRGEGQRFSVNTPASSVRLVSDGAPETYIELELDRSGPQPAVIGRASAGRGAGSRIIAEEAIGDGKAIAALPEDDVARFILATVPKLVIKA